MLAQLTHMPRRAKQAVLWTLDMVLVPVSYIVALMVSSSSLAGPASVIAEMPTILVLTASAGVLSILLGLPKVQLKSYELSALGRSAALGSVLAGQQALLIVAGISSAPSGAPVILAMSYLVFSASARMMLLQILLIAYRRTTPERHVLIYGAGKTGIQLAMALRAAGEYRVVGFVDDNPSLHGMTVAGNTVYPAKRLDSLIKSSSIERVLLAMPSLSMPRQAQIARRISALQVEVQTLPSFAQLIGEEDMVQQLAPVLPNQVLGREHLDAALDGVCDAYNNRTIMITGAGGSIGSELCRQILSCKPRKLVLLEISEFALFQVEREIEALLDRNDCDVIATLGSVTDANLVRALIEKHDVNVVLHAAAYKHVPMVEKNPIAGIQNNVFGTLVVAQAAFDAKIERFVLISTDKAVRPLGLMGVSKRLAEICVGDLARRGAATVFTMVRFGNVLGSSGSVIPIFNEQISRGGPITVTDPDVTRYFMTIQEACKLVLMAGNLAEGGEIFILDMGKPVRIADLARQVVAAAGYSVRDKDNPEGDIEIIVTGLRAGEKLHEELTLNRTLRPTKHPKLARANESILSAFEVARAIQALRAALEAEDAEALVEEAFRWVSRDTEHNALYTEKHQS